MKHFIITYDYEDYIMLSHKLEGLIRKSEDSIIFYRQCNRCEEDITRLGASPEPFGDGVYIL